VKRAQAGTQRSESEWGYWSYWYHVTSEVRDDRVLVFIDTLYPGTFEYVYVANAIHHGDFNQSPTRAEEMHEDRVAYSKRIIDSQALKRRGTAEELAAAVSFLAGPDSSFVTGQTLNVDGGWIMA